MRVLIDTNVVLDFLQEREPFVENAARLFERIDTGEIEGFIAVLVYVRYTRRGTALPISVNLS
jgi:predicted nucleic acid-binding protein